MISKSFGGFFEQFHHCYNTSTSSDEWVPDSAASALASEPENSTPCSPVSSYTSEKALDESGILLNLEAVSTPPSPDKTCQHDYEHINEITTAMMELQVNEDRILKNLQTVLCLSPQSAPQLDKYISPSLRNRLNSSSQLSIAAGKQGGLGGIAFPPKGSGVSPAVAAGAAKKRSLSGNKMLFTSLDYYLNHLPVSQKHCNSTVVLRGIR